MKAAVELSSGAKKGDSVARQFEEIGAGFMQAALSGYPASVEEAAMHIARAMESGHKLLVFGNGGSASDAQHICGELIVRFRHVRKALPAIALCCDPAVLTACANDFSYDDVFARQIEALGMSGDVALGISTSGNSANVVRALQTARARGLFNILLTGSARGKACEFCDLLLAAPGATAARIQELHIASYHAICEMLDERFKGLK